MEMIEEAVRASPNLSNPELQRRAARIGPSVPELSPRSFNARYPLQVRRKLSQEKAEKSTAEGETDVSRAEVRAALLDFAKAVVGAEDQGKAIEVLMGVDEYVDRVVGAG